MFNGHKNWNHWNVSLWISNDECLYRRARALATVHTRPEAAERLLQELPSHTPDGAPYNKTSIRAALRDL